MTREESNIWIENTFSDFTKEEVAKEPKEETTGIKPLTFKSIYETDFWVKCYMTALESNKYTNAPSSIADMAILELRERIQEDE